jgi:hypothetical protein
VRFYFPDSQDQVDPRFDFRSESSSPYRNRQRHCSYAHEMLDPPPYEGLLLSKAMIDRHGGAGRYTAQQRQRFYREGVREFFRLDALPGKRIETLGDCGAFTYIKDEVPPYSTDEVISFYEENSFDAGVSVDHIIKGLHDDAAAAAGSPIRRRYDLTLDLAEEFLRRHGERGCAFQPVGVAQGWSAGSYAEAVRRLQDLGYLRIALGGMVLLKTQEILDVLAAIDEIRLPATELHLFGVTRTQQISRFSGHGVTSFDSTSPFRRAFKDETNNYYFGNETYVALRIPQVEGNTKLEDRIRAGQVGQGEARRLEQAALQAVREYDEGKVGIEAALTALCEYQALHDPSILDIRRGQYLRTLSDAPWKECGCQVCKDVGVEVIVFRGSERNKRRGFHNLAVFAQLLAEARKSSETLPVAA